MCVNITKLELTNDWRDEMLGKGSEIFLTDLMI